MTIVNESSVDAVVNLAEWDTDLLVRSVYIDAGSTYTLRDIRPGSYRMVFTQGMDWDDQNVQFRSDASYFKFGRALDFEERRDGSSIHYKALSVTLNAVPDGNVQRVEVGPDEFKGLLAQRKHS